MEDLFKKFVYTGVGLVSLTAEKLENSVSKLVDENKITTEEGKKIVDDLMSKTEVKKDEFEAKLKEVTEAVVAKFDFLKKHDYETLVKRVEALEAEVAKKKTTKKAVA